MLPIGSDLHPENEPHPQVDIAEFKLAAGSFATGVTVVTTRGPDGRLHGCTASSFTSLSLDPPLVLFCLDRRAPTRTVLERSGHFAVNVLSAEQENASRQFARYAEDKFVGIEVTEGTTGAPLLTGALAQIECVLDRSLYGGDHVIVIGRVLGVHVYDGPPLIYHRARYYRI